MLQLGLRRCLRENSLSRIQSNPSLSHKVSPPPASSLSLTLHSSSSIKDITWRWEGKHHHLGSVSPSGQFVIQNFTLEHQGQSRNPITVPECFSVGKYSCFDREVPVDEFEVRVPYSQEESQSVFNSSSQSDQQFDQAHYLRSSTSS